MGSVCLGAVFLFIGSKFIFGSNEHTIAYLYDAWPCVFLYHAKRKEVVL